MNVGRIRDVIAVMVGILFGCFGVFIFSDFQYRGLTLEHHVWPLFQQHSFEKVSEGLFILLGSSFMVDFFNAFSATSVEESSLGTIITSDTVWPVLCTWLFGGLCVGVIAKGAKRGLIMGIVTFFFVIILWVIWGFFASADMTAIFQDNLGVTLGNFFTVFIMLEFCSILGGSISGPFDID